MTDWTEKYRPRTLDGVVGNPSAVNSMRAWARSWESGIPELRALVLIGPPGVGKTTSAEALAREMGWGIVEMNASDQRKGSAIEDIAIRGSMFNTFDSDGSYLDAGSGGRKLIVLDEADNFFGNNDRGAMPMVNRLITETRQPVILIVNDYYGLSRKSSAVKTKTLQITFKKPQASTVAKALYKIAEAESVEVDPAAMDRIAENAGGDMRAAIRNLESMALGTDAVTKEMSDGLSYRDSRTDLFGMMSSVFRKGDALAARAAVMSVDEEPGTKLLWIDENLPTEFIDNGDLMRAYEKMSKAALYLGRAGKAQYYGFWSYATDMMSIGVVSSRMSDRYGRDRMRFPSYLTRMSRIKTVRGTRAMLNLKFSAALHTTSGRIDRDVIPFIGEAASKDPSLRASLVCDLGLEDDELGYLIGKKPDSKDVKAAMAEAARRIEEADLARKAARAPPVHVASAVPAAVPVENTVKAEPPPQPAKESKPAAPRPKAQRSLFDF